MSSSKTQGAPAGPRRRPWTAAEKTACLQAFAASGQSATAFCRAHGVPRATLALWRRTAGATPAHPQPSGEAAPPARFAQVELVDRPASPAAATPKAITTAAMPAPPEFAPLTLALRTPAGLEAVVTGLDATTTVAVLRGVLVPLPPRRAGVA